VRHEKSRISCEDKKRARCDGERVRSAVAAGQEIKRCVVPFGVCVCVRSLSLHSILSALVTCNNLASVCVLQEVGSIIGKKGEIVKRFREEVSFYFKVGARAENGALKNKAQ
jgi:hypothetical protein